MEPQPIITFRVKFSTSGILPGVNDKQKTTFTPTGTQGSTENLVARDNHIFVLSGQKAVHMKKLIESGQETNIEIVNADTPEPDPTPTPLEADGLILLFDARFPDSLELSDSETVLSWTSLVGEAVITPEEGSEGKFPTFVEDVIDGEPGVDFDGVDDYLSTNPAPSLPTQFTLTDNTFTAHAIVTDFESAGTLFALLDKTFGLGLLTTIIIGESDELSVLVVDNYADEIVVGASLAADGFPYIITVVSDTESDTVLLFVNGGSTNTGSYEYIFSGNDFNAFDLGGGFASGEERIGAAIPWACLIDKAQNKDEVNAVLEYLSSNYGISYTPVDFTIGG